MYKYKDDKGNVQYTDKPQTLPAERLNVQSQKTDIVAVQARQEAEQKRMQDADSRAARPAAQAADEKAGRRSSRPRTKPSAAPRRANATTTYMNSQRLYEQDENGERRYLSDAELSCGASNAKASMDVMCK